MSFRAEVVSLILKKISKNNERIRAIKDEANKFSLDPTKEGAYIARIGYGEALKDILEEIRSTNAGRESGSNF